MTKVVNCECGASVRGETDDELVSAVEQHVRQDHPEMVGQMSRDDIMAMAEEA
jgi:predicted small metal-binding protein